jgi:hypothetical protein
LKPTSSAKQAVKVYVRSKRVAVQSFACERYVPSVIGSVKITNWVVQYENRLDDAQQAILKYADDLSTSAGLPIEVIDVSKLNIIRRLVTLFFRRDLYRTPAVLFPETAFSRIMKRTYLLPPSTTTSQFNSSDEVIYRDISSSLVSADLK